jgi:hypothetical protein
MTWLDRLFCAHDYLKGFAPDRVCLRCVKCGRETTGWTIKKPAHVIDARGQFAPRRIEPTGSTAAHDSLRAS